jgi:hypothetical protein
MLLNPDDELSEIIPLRTAAATAGVTPRTVRRWIDNGHLELVPNMPGRWTTRRAVLECERDRHLASKQGRPGARVPGLTC